jgi:hypothetical protein
VYNPNHGKFIGVTAEGVVQCSATSAGSSEQFDLMDRGNGMVAFRSVAHGTYLRCTASRDGSRQLGAESEHSDQSNWHIVARVPPSAPPPTPPSIPAPPAPPPSPAWHVDTTGGQSCTAVCAAAGKTCSPDDTAANNDAIDSAEDIQSLLQSLLGYNPCSSTNGGFGTAGDVPLWRNIHGGECYYNSAGRAASTIRCDTTVSSDRYRICYCSLVGGSADGTG